MKKILMSVIMVVFSLNVSISVHADSNVKDANPTNTQREFPTKNLVWPSQINVLFPDEDLAKMVALELTLETDDKYNPDSIVTQDVLDKVNDLWSRDGRFYVESLEGVGYLHNLRILYLDDNGITNIPSELKQLPLTQLDFTANEITDMRVLNYFTSNIVIAAGYQMIDESYLGEFAINDVVATNLPVIFEQATDPNDVLFSNNIQPVEIIQGPEGTFLEGTMLHLPTNKVGTYKVEVRINGGKAYNSVVSYIYTVK